MAMGVANSAARVLVRFGADGGHPAYVRTYPCKPGAKAYPGWHAFGFPWWEPDREEAFVGPGCTSEFSKRSNKFSDAMPGLHFHGDPLWYERGLPESAFALSGDALPVRECEPFVALDVQDVSGNTLNADYPDCSVLQFDRAGLIEVVVGHTLAQQVVRWLGCTVGTLGGSAFDGVYTVLFDGAVVTPVDARTVSVTVAGSTPSIGPLGNTSGAPPFFYSLGPIDLSTLWQFSSDAYTLYLPRDGDVGPGYYFYLQRVPGSGAGGPTLLPYPGDTATVNGIDIPAGYELVDDLSWALLVKLSPAGISPQEWLALPSGAGGGGGGGSLTVGTTPIVGGSTGDYLRIGGGGILASGGLDVPVVLVATGDTVVPLATKAHSGTQSGHLQDWLSSGGTPLAFVSKEGDLCANRAGTWGILAVGPNADYGMRGGSGIGRLVLSSQGGDVASFQSSGVSGVLTVVAGDSAKDFNVRTYSADADVANRTLFESSDSGKLCWKDASGTVHQLY